MFRRILIANRGEIAVRIARACRELGVESVAVYSDADRLAPHVAAADCAVHIGPAPARDSYLRIDNLLSAAKESGCDAVHPGYGFLSENAAFARAVNDAGATFIGPQAEAIEAMGDKVKAREIAAAAGVPLPPSASIERNQDAGATCKSLGFPLLVKAAAGGGGKGMRRIDSDDEVEAAIATARREALSAFGDDRVYLERYVERGRHVEVQILADASGNAVHLGERECSIQRRHQKIIEESPSPAVDENTREKLVAAALALTHAVDYRNAGTVEFLLADNGDIFFLEMNTRLQVEHPITEWVSAIDIVQSQIRIAAGESLWFGQEDVSPRGHAIECRIYAEDPERDFAPSPSKIELLHLPHAPWLRLDNGVCQGFDIPLDYDPMLAKISVWADDRASARHRMIGALEDIAVLGPTTNIDFLLDVLAHDAFSSGATHTGFLNEHFEEWSPSHRDLDLAAVAAAVHRARQQGTKTSDRIATRTPWNSLGSWRPFGDKQTR